MRHGFLLQIDAPDLALERHITYKDRPVAAFVDFVERVVADHQSGAAQRAARPRAPARVLGQFRIAARCRRAARGHSPGAAAGQCRRLRAAVRQSAPRPRVPLLREASARGRPDPRRRRHRQPDEFRRAPGGGGGPPRARRRRSSAIRRACWPAPIAASTPRPAGAASPRTWCGRSSRACATARGSRRSGCLRARGSYSETLAR